MITTQNIPTTCLLCDDRDARTPSVLCGGCYLHIRTNTATLAWAHGWLRSSMLSLAPAWKQGSIHTAAGASRPPFAVQLHDARTLIEGVLHDWAVNIGEKHTPALAGPKHPDPATVATWLIARLPWLSEQDWVTDYAAEIAETRQTVYGLAPWERPRRDLPLPCPTCEQLTLSTYAGDDGIVCRDRDCAAIITWHEYETEVHEWNDMLPTAA